MARTMKLTKTDLRKAAKRAQSLSTRLATVRKKTEKVTEQLVHTVEVGTAAFTMGVVQGKTGGIEIVGVPLELGLGIGLNLMGYVGLGGKMSDHLHGFGDGCLAAYLTTLGRGAGLKWKAGEAQKALGEGKTSGAQLSDAELAAMAAAA